MKKFDFIGFINWDVKTNHITRDEAIEKLKEYCKEYSYSCDYEIYEIDTFKCLPHYDYDNAEHIGNNFVQKIIDFINSINDGRFVYDKETVNYIIIDTIRSITQYDDYSIEAVSKLIETYNEFNFGWHVLDTEDCSTLLISDLINFKAFYVNLSEEEINSMDNEAFLLYMSQKDWEKFYEKFKRIKYIKS